MYGKMKEFGFTDIIPFVWISALLGQLSCFCVYFYSLMAVKAKVLFSFLSAVRAYQLTGMAGINDDYNTLCNGECREKESKLGSQARRKREGDWLLKRTSILPFWQSLSYTPPKKNSLKGWSRSWRSGIWWSHSFEKISASEITECHLGNLVSLKDHCDLFFVFKVNITSHISVRPHVDPTTLVYWYGRKYSSSQKRWGSKCGQRWRLLQHPELRKAQGLGA